MKLVTVKGNPDAAPFLYGLLLERPAYARITHVAMPAPSEHEVFVANHPFRYWYLIDMDGTYVGALECTDLNELGIHILKAYQNRGYGAQALRLFIGTHQPLPPIKAVRNGRWIANIGTENHGAKLFFKRMGFAKIQETLAL